LPSHTEDQRVYSIHIFLRLIDTAATEEEESGALDDFAEKWDKRYPHVCASWKKNGAEIVTFFKYPPLVRTLVHTTNPIESLHQKIMKASKNKAIFPMDRLCSNWSTWLWRRQKRSGP
jgi:transposase-like protein